ncbi:MAG TPA: helix-turn-helix domain-containing protein [Opitutaceae bacterium]|nr:helix-turn-helix domain-containing protein [Opitutaceae bacterium]
MAQNTLKKIAEYKSKLAELERERSAQLVKLPAQFGFSSAEDFIAAFQQAAAGKAPRKAAKPAETKTKSGRKPRAKITPEVVELVKKLVGEGKTGAEVAKAAGVSLPTVQNLKKKLGLVGKR